MVFGIYSFRNQGAGAIMYSNVITHFETFLREIELLPNERSDAEAKALRIAKSLFAAYNPGVDFSPSCYAIVGSYGKGTAARPRTDLDMIFVLPNNEYPRINGIQGNKQSYLLQEVKTVLLDTFPSTDIKGDGPVVKVPFSTYYLEVVPVFRWEGDLFITPHTKNGGSWGHTNPASEINWLKDVDNVSLGKATHLVKMLKAWKQECNVELRSICLEIAATIFLNQWPERQKTMVYYDFMVRDFFAFLLRYVNGSAKPAGITEWIPLGDAWASKAQSAYDRAVKACAYEQNDQEFSAALEWQKIFGSKFHAQFDLAKALAAIAISR
jgi:hypothetical protein